MAVCHGIDTRRSTRPRRFCWLKKVGVPGAAAQLGLHESQLYGWRGKDRLQRDRGEADRQLSADVVRLKRQLAEHAEELAILKKAAYFARNQK